MSHHHGSGQQPPTDAELQQQIATESGSVNQFQGAQTAKQAADQAIAAIDGMFGGGMNELVAELKLLEDKAPVATGGGGGYKFSPSQIEDQLKQCEDLIDGLKNDDLPKAQRITKTPSPAMDTVASVPQAQAVQQMGARLEQRIQNQITFVKNWQQQLQNVKNSYLEQEGHTEATWKSLQA